MQIPLHTQIYHHYISRLPVIYLGPVYIFHIINLNFCGLHHQLDTVPSCHHRNLKHKHMFLHVTPMSLDSAYTISLAPGLPNRISSCSKDCGIRGTLFSNVQPNCTLHRFLLQVSNVMYLQVGYLCLRDLQFSSDKLTCAESLCTWSSDTHSCTMQTSSA